MSHKKINLMTISNCVKEHQCTPEKAIEILKNEIEIEIEKEREEVKSKDKNRLIKSVSDSTWSKLKAVAAILQISMGAALTEIIEHYLKTREIK